MKTYIISFIAIAAVSGIAACSNDATGPAPLATTTNTAADSAAAAAAGGYYGQPTTPRIRLIATLTAPVGGTFRHAKGSAHWDTRNTNSKRELEIEVEDVTAGTQVDFFVNNVKVGATTTVDALGHASINLSTELGQTVPTAAAGLAAEVRTVAGAVIVTGLFPKS